MTTQTAVTSSRQENRTPLSPDFAGIKQRQQATWASADFAVIGVTLQIVGESLAEAVDIRAGERVLDVAAGNGNATLAAARRFQHPLDLIAGLQREVDQFAGHGEFAAPRNMKTAVPP